MNRSSYSFMRSTACFLLAAGIPAAAHAQAEQCAVSRQLPRLEAAHGTPTETVLRINAAPHVGGHGQVIFGQGPFYLSHLAVFMGLPEFHPHNFQVILEVAFADADAEAAFLDSVRTAPDELHTAVPPRFDQIALVTDEPGRLLRRTLPETRIVRGHFEQGGEDIVLPTDLGVDRLVYFREFVTGGEKLEHPQYLLFGRADEMFLSHRLSAPPDFQQILRVEFTGEGNTQDILPTQLDALLSEGLLLTMPERANAAAERLRPDDSLVCAVDTGTRLPLTSAGIRVVQEVYCEEGELTALVTDRFNDPARCAP